MPMVFDNVEGGGAAMTGGGADARRLAAKISEAWIAFAASGNPNAKKKWIAAMAGIRFGEAGDDGFDNESRIALDPMKTQRLIFERKGA